MDRNVYKSILVSLILSLLLLSSVCLAKSLKTPEIADCHGKAIVTIKTDRGMGSGFILRPSGVIVTNLHVL